MRQIIGFLGSLGIGVILTAAGLVLDAKSLLYSGIIIFALMAALWLWAWARPEGAATTGGTPPALLDETPMPEGLSGPEQAIYSLRRARENAAIASAQRGKVAGQLSRRAFHELEAAMLSIKREFGIPPLNFAKAAQIEHRYRMPAYMAFVDSILPLLSEGHIDQAKAQASKFRWSWGGE